MTSQVIDPLPGIGYQERAIRLFAEGEHHESKKSALRIKAMAVCLPWAENWESGSTEGSRSQCLANQLEGVIAAGAPSSDLLPLSCIPTAMEPSVIALDIFRKGDALD
jgi:hypothetical protein